MEPREENSYYIWSDWGDAKVVGDCPPNDGRTVFLYSIENNGAGEYILLSTAMDTVTTWSFDFDAVTNGDGIYGPSTENAVAIPTPLVTNVVQDTPGVVTAVLNWPAITNLKGFYDKDPGKNLITGIVVRYYQAGTSPATFKASDWPVADVINIGEQGTDPGEVTVKVPYTRGMRTFVALSLLFDGGKPALDSSPAFTETVFIGHPVEVKLDTGPAPTAEFGFIKVVKRAKGLQTDWTMVKEVGVEFYTAVGKNRKGTLLKLGGVRADTDGVYSLKSRVAEAVGYVQLAAYLNDGSTVSGDWIQVGRRGGPRE